MTNDGDQKNTDSRATTSSSADSSVGTGGKRWFGMGVMLILVVGLGGWGSLSLSKTKKELPKVHRVARGGVKVAVTEQGTLESFNNTEIKCRVRGFNMVTYVVETGTIVQPGDVLVRLDTKNIDDTLSTQQTKVHEARATLEESKASVAEAGIAIDAYLEGTFKSAELNLTRQVEVASENLRIAQSSLTDSERLFKKGFVTDLEVEGNKLTVNQAELELKVKEVELEVLRNYTKAMRLKTLEGNLKASTSKMEADQAGLTMDQIRLDRALEELTFCEIKADREGMVIYPSAAAHKTTPDITEGATVRKDQVLLLMPDLDKMQVKVGIHESVVDRLRVGMKAEVNLPDMNIEGTVKSISTVTRPAGWWTGNVVKYDTIIELPKVDGLKPGMSAEVRVVLAQYDDVLQVPVSAVIETDEGQWCWVWTEAGSQKRKLEIEDTDEKFVVVTSGIKEGDQVVLNPSAYFEEARAEALGVPDASPSVAE
ncbi:MAG: HlyD family efflux transporter periplasmic adaptor subunit [Planctomycetota bacterium]|nr:HlyD family efflux transporter periplasmic adaptor subunit [Planctomycetota bacterium]